MSGNISPFEHRASFQWHTVCGLDRNTLSHVAWPSDGRSEREKKREHSLAWFKKVCYFSVCSFSIHFRAHSNVIVCPFLCRVQFCTITNNGNAVLAQANGDHRHAMRGKWLRHNNSEWMVSHSIYEIERVRKASISRHDVLYYHTTHTTQYMYFLFQSPLMLSWQERWYGKWDRNGNALLLSGDKPYARFEVCA